MLKIPLPIFSLSILKKKFIKKAFIPTQAINSKSALRKTDIFCIKNHTKTPGTKGAEKPMAIPLQTVFLIANSFCFMLT